MIGIFRANYMYRMGRALLPLPVATNLVATDIVAGQDGDPWTASIGSGMPGYLRWTHLGESGYEASWEPITSDFTYDGALQDISLTTEETFDQLGGMWFALQYQFAGSGDWYELGRVKREVVTSSNTAPTVTLGTIPTGVVAGASLTIPYTIEDDGTFVDDGIVVSIDGSPVAATSVSSTSATVTAPAAGTHTVSVTYTDAGGLSDSDTGSVTTVAAGLGLAQYLFWDFELDEESAGSVAVNRVDSQNGVTFTDFNTTPSTTGLHGRAANFTEANTEFLQGTYAHLQSVLAALNGAAAWTIEIWYKPTDLVSQCRPYSFEGTNYVYVNTNGSVLARATEASGGFARECTTAADLIAVGAWNQVVVRWNGTQLQLCVNGVQRTFVNMATHTSTPAAATDRPTIGARANQFNSQYYCNGPVDLFRVYTGHSVTDGELTSLYNGGAGQPRSAL